jgi:murein DD-endopeptidase MepM/ murein hydrolase activator NlpD
MRRRPVVVGVALALVAGAVGGSVGGSRPASGQSVEPDPTTSSSTSSTTAPDGSTTTTGPGDPSTTSSTAVTGSVTTATTAMTEPGATSSTTGAPGPGVDDAQVSVDPLAGAFLTPQDQDLYEALDGLGDARSGFYAAQPAFDPAVANAVLEPEVLRARAALDRALASQQEAASHEATAAAELASAAEAVGGLDDERRARVEAAARAEEDLRRRAVDAYVRRGGGIDVSVLVGAATAGHAAQRAGLLDAVLRADVAAVRRAEAAVDGLDAGERAGADRLATARRTADAATEARRAADWERMAAESTLAMYEAGSHVAIAGFVFPVAGDVSFIDSYGAPRNVGTGYEHWHEGTDVMAAMGTPLVAVEDGVIVRARPNSLGGNAIRLRGASGHGFYYAHLAAYAPGIAEGSAVAAGQLLGFVGDTGDARGGAPHLHFEIHRPDSGEPVNPYPLLAVAWRARQEAPAGPSVPTPAQATSSPMGQLTPVPPRPQ